MSSGDATLSFTIIFTRFVETEMQTISLSEKSFKEDVKNVLGYVVRIADVCSSQAVLPNRKKIQEKQFSKIIRLEFLRAVTLNTD